MVTQVSWSAKLFMTISRQYFQNAQPINIYKMIKSRTESDTEYPKALNVIDKPIIGWLERIDLPELGIFALKAKIDTGARTSALHVTKVRPFQKSDGSEWLELHIPATESDGSEQDMVCEMPSFGKRSVKSSSGHLDERYVLTSRLKLAAFEEVIEITLTNRMSMRYSMLLGRSALRNNFLIDPSRSYIQSASASHTTVVKKVKKIK